LHLEERDKEQEFDKDITMENEVAKCYIIGKFENINKQASISSHLPGFSATWEPGSYTPEV
jgi:hypothetical protein